SRGAPVAASGRYRKSEEMLERALRTIPLGSQTFSKSKTQYPYGVSPYFIQKGRGSHVWDVDGNEYVDFISSLASITLGYNDPDVTAAVRAQLDEGVIFSLPHPIEVQAAEKIAELVPCAEMVRFGKNGSDATAGAIRLARAYTGRDHVAVCGYHGWQDWYIGSTARNRGVPQATRDMTHSFAYNDLDSLHRIFKKYHGRIAAVMLEPMNVAAPHEGLLHGIQELCRKNGALLIFDETITGFRYATGGAQEYFGITPDLATFGKGLANGYPLSAVAGRADVMCLLEEVFFSFTFGGETLSLAAAVATMKKLQTEPVIATLASQGQKIIESTVALIEKHDVAHILSISGHPSWTFLSMRDVPPYSSFHLKTLYMQEMQVRGILSLGTHNLSYSHSDADLERLCSAYDELFPMLRDAVANARLESYLRCPPLEPLFKVR
ncbi:MAG TPA: aminotransferase class III-fold pyridoxal phosphate-dependent enzyme, partial [Nitrosospira sp.]|nr:aminotransferase class III-fold pyridoxal phosphate-dependent enzyme [Nitrosospira sp.]